LLFVLKKHFPLKYILCVYIIEILCGIHVCIEIGIGMFRVSLIPLESMII